MLALSSPSLNEQGWRELKNVQKRRSDVCSTQGAPRQWDYKGLQSAFSLVLYESPGTYQGAAHGSCAGKHVPTLLWVFKVT